jgi:hypothetical protein
MIINDIKFDYYINYLGKSVHLLDLSNSHFKTLLNAMCADFQKKLIEEEALLQDVLGFDWICYGQSGLIMEFNKYGLQFISKGDKRLHAPYRGHTEDK